MHLDLHQNHNHPKFANNLKTQGKKHLIREGDDAAFVIHVEWILRLILLVDVHS